MVDFPALIDAAWLAARLHDPLLVVLDATYRLPNEGRDAGADFRAAHIPGAQFFDVDRFADPAEAALPHMVPTPALAREMLQNLGINRDSLVVIYDQKGIFSAPRGWFLLRLFGHDRVCVLDGGLPGWQAAGFAVTQGAPAAAARGNFEPRYRARLLRGFGDMRDNLASGGELVLDARPAPRFYGTAPEPRPGLRGGHIPGSRSLPFGELLVEGRMKPAAELRAVFAGLGAVDRAVVTSCGSGVSAAVLTLGMVVAGLPIGALYDGSWSEWGGRADAPVEV